MKFKFFTFIFFALQLKAQNLHVKYIEVRSAIASASEDLYISNNQSLDIKDSIVNFVKMRSDGSIDTKIKKLPNRNYLVRDLNIGKDSVANFIFNSKVKDKMYIVSDDVKIPRWTVSKNKRQKILGYNCVQATTNFRGRNYTAYYTPDIRISSGPFKFFGLKGLILEIRENNSDRNIWKAVKIDEQREFINTKIFANKDLPHITMKDFVALLDNELVSWSANLSASLPAGTKMETAIPDRLATEKKFEWEEHTSK